MRAWLAIAALTGAALIGAGCGADGYADDDDDDATDAGASACEVSFSFSPQSPRAPTTVVATGTIDGSGGVGLESYVWTVMRGDTPIETSPRNADESEIEFDAAVAGPYFILLEGNVDGQACAPYSTTINVTDANANEVDFRLALIPPDGVAAPAQRQLVRVPGGADFDLGPRTLDSGLAVAGVLQASSGVTAGYLRVVPTAEPALAMPSEVFASAAGEFSLRLLAGAYDVLVVPDGDAIAPALLRGIEATALTGALSVPDSQRVTGTVVRADDSPVVGARVALTVAGVPSTIGLTDDSGAFEVRAHTGGATAVSVVVPDGSLPGLELDAAAGLVADPDTALTIRYVAGAAARSETFALLASDDSTPVVGARVTLLARPIAAAGTVTPGAAAALDAVGSARGDATAGVGGQVGPLSLPPAVYDVVVAPPLDGAGDDVARLTTVDLTGAAPALTSLALAPPATVGAAAAGVPAGTRVTAVPTGLLARAGAPSVETATTNADRVELSLVGGGEYEITLHLSAASGRAPTRFLATAPAAGASLELAAVEVPDAISITGRVVSPDIAGGVGGVAVWLLCGDCAGPAASVPIAEAVSAADGAFTLRIPDPGTAE